MPTREQLAARAIELSGRVSGVTETFDPQGYFALVTEGRQAENTRIRAAWDRADPAKRSAKKPVKFSACEELSSRIAWEACGMPVGTLPWCNRIEAGNKWQPGRNMARLRESGAWHAWGPGSVWRADVADPVQVIWESGLAHTLILTAIRGEHGLPTSVDLAEYGQVIDPDGTGPAPLDDAGRCRVNVPVKRKSDGCWYVGSGRVYGHISIGELQSRWAPSEADTDPAPATPPRAAQPTLPGTSRTLRQGMSGDDVRALQAALGMGNVDGQFGPMTAAKLRAFQLENVLVADAIAGPVTLGKLGL